MKVEVVGERVVSKFFLLTLNIYIIPHIPHEYDYIPYIIAVV